LRPPALFHLAVLEHIVTGESVAAVQVPPVALPVGPMLGVDLCAATPAAPRAPAA
jgi:hypothetical protein